MHVHATFLRACAAAAPLLFLISADLAFAQGGAPAFPQRFELRGPEAASYGFAVTQPGPIAVEVRSKNPQPLRLTLAGSNRVENAGAGRVALKYNVTPEDIQRGILWTVSISQQMPGAAPVTGEINLRSPAADPAAAQRAALAQRPSQQQVDQAIAQAGAGVEQHIAVRRTDFNQQLMLRDQREHQKLQALLAQPAASRISTRAIAPQSPAQQEKIATIDRRLAPLPPPPPPQIAALEQTSGGPLSAVVINGTGFGSAGGRVMLSVPAGLVIPCANCAPLPTATLPDQAMIATIASWSDSRIVIALPDLTGVPQYAAQIFVVRGDNAYSNRAAFGFVPRPEVRFIRGVPGDRRYTTTVVTQPLPATGASSQMMHVRIPAFPFSEFVGEKGNDEYFLNTDLQNGWTVSNVKLFPIGELGGIPPEINTILRESGGAYIAGTPGGSDLSLNVRWWINALKPFMFYVWSIEITGAAGVPDGVVIK